jgi:hypothetical protein
MKVLYNLTLLRNQTYKDKVASSKNDTVTVLVPMLQCQTDGTTDVTDSLINILVFLETAKDLRAKAFSLPKAHVS